MTLPDPFHEIRLRSLRTVAGANFWSRRPVTLLEVAIGAYDDLSSAEAPGLTEALLAALPGLVEHRCSIGERGGFVTRLRRGTYAAHIVEHVALELQGMIGHEVAFGRARGGAAPGEYTVVFRHRHAGVGRRAGAHALEVVQRAFAGCLEPAFVARALEELRALAATPAEPAPAARVACGVAGGPLRHAVLAELARAGVPGGAPLVGVAPAYLVQAGVPYAAARVAVIADVDAGDAPRYYREQAARLLSVVADALEEDGAVIAPADQPELHEWLGESGRRVVTFRDGCAAEAAARARDLLGAEDG